MRISDWSSGVCSSDLKDYVPRTFELDREGGELEEYTDEEYTDEEYTDGGYTNDVGGLDEFAPQGEGGTRTLARPPRIDGMPPDSATVDSVAGLPTDSLHAPPDSLGMAVQDSVIQKDTVIAGERVASDSTLLATHLERVEAVSLSTELGHDALARNLTADSVLREHAVIPTGGEADSLLDGALASRLRPSTDSIPSDSLARSEEHPSELQSLMRISYAVF